VSENIQPILIFWNTYFVFRYAMYTSSLLLIQQNLQQGVRNIHKKKT